ncbi:glutaminyl-tRNA synthetase [Paragonimus westermani]|uniref:glutamine--tRNA ligase n=1 Tax=Paragonimus westermani TaxID=34504 RepID=A0A5J4P0H7_9TREM|nr:glutaminyl-tRNA synthetase [Paragonimus westermani]
MSQTILDPSALEACVRDYLNDHVPRVMAVLDPLRIRISNWNELYPNMDVGEVDVPDFPSIPDSKTHKCIITPEVYVDATDFQEVPDKGYRRLTPNQSVGLRHAGLVFQVNEIIKDDSGKVIELVGTAKSVEEVAKPKAFIQWVSKPIHCEVRLYDRL